MESAKKICAYQYEKKRADEGGGEIIMAQSKKINIKTNFLISCCFFSTHSLIKQTHQIKKIVFTKSH